MIDRANVMFGAFERTAELAASTIIAIICAVAAHSKASITLGNTDRQEFRVFSIARIDGNVAVAVIDVADCVVYILYVIGGVADKRTLIKWEEKYVFSPKCQRQR